MDLLQFNIDMSGLKIPEEMMTGASRQAFEQTVATELPNQFARALYAIPSGVPVSARNFR